MISRSSWIPSADSTSGFDCRLDELELTLAGPPSRLPASGVGEGFVRLGTLCPNREPPSKDRLEEEDPDSVCVWDREKPDELVAEPHDFECRSWTTLWAVCCVIEGEGRRADDGRGTRLATRGCDGSCFANTGGSVCLSLVRGVDFGMPLNNLESSGRRRKPSEGLAGNPYPTLGDTILFQPLGKFVVFQTCLLQY